MLFLCLSLWMTTAQAASLKVMTYNAWLLDLPFQWGAQDVSSRLKALPIELAKTGADIIALQEVWAQKDKIYLVEHFRQQGYEHSYYEDLPPSFFLRGWIGNGLMVVSKYPLQVETRQKDRVLAFQDYTRPDEYLARKGALHVKVQISEHQQISLYNTHLGAISFVPEKQIFHAEHEASRLRQAEELFQFIMRTRDQRAVVLAGDFNSHFLTYAHGEYTDELVSDYRRMTCDDSQKECLALQDSFMPSLTHSDRAQGMTADPGRNPYIGRTRFYRHQAPARRMDYVFVTKDLPVRSAALVLTELLSLPDRKGAWPLSDHFGVLAEIELRF